MCGIAGILRWDGEPMAVDGIRWMIQAMAHRGPDGEGILVDHQVVFGHRRLAIIDLETGRQPMTNDDRTVWVTYNGEIYNYRELREELEAQGHRFRTHSDTEVLIRAYEEWGTECLQRLRGMFAFGLADFRRRCLLLVRDPLGIKPLYYRLNAKELVFGSEISSMRCGAGPSLTGSLQAIEFFLRYQYIPTPSTIYREVSKLPPATWLQVGFDGHVNGPVEYWRPRFETEEHVSEAEWIDRVRTVVTTSVKTHLVADVPVGVLLSGGTDSTIVASAMREVLRQPVQAFAIGFEEKAYSELAYAQQAAKQLDLDLHVEMLGEHALDVLEELIAHYGEPFGDSSAVAVWHVSRLARSAVPVVLSGDGGDEGFGGYQSYLRWMDPGLLRRAARLMQPQLTAWQQMIEYVNLPTRRALWKPAYRDLTRRPCELFETSSRQSVSWDRLAYAQHLDLKTYLPCDILAKVDVASMAHGLEVRTPFVDREVLATAMRLPIGLRFGHHDGAGRPVGKYALKKVLQRNFPPEFVYRTKQGFGIPRSVWFLPSHYGRKVLEDVLLDPDSRLQEWLRPESIRSHLRAHTERYDNSDRLWLLLVLGVWLRQHPEVSFS